MFTRVSFVLVVLALLGAVAGCSDSPVAQYEAGKAALESARLAEANIYAPEALKAATDSLNAALVEMQKQDGRFAALRSYGKSQEMIATAQQLAQKAATEAAAEKERVRVADSVLIAEVELLISESRNIMATAPKGKGSRIDLKVMQSDLDAASSALAVATEEFTAGNYQSAHERLEAVKSQVAKTRTDLDAAIAKLKKK